MMANISGITTLTGQLMTNMIRGYSAYEIAVQEGFEGTVEEWLASLVGDSVEIEVVEDTSSSYILRFTVGDEVVTTPNLRQNLNDMRAQISDMQTIVNSHGAQIVNLQSADQALDARVTALEEGGGGSSSDLADRVTTLEENGFITGQRLLTLDTHVESIDAQITELESKTSEIQSKVDSFEQAIDGLTTQVTGLDTEVTTLGSDVTNMKSGVATLTSDVSDLKSDVADLKADNTSVKSRLSNVESSVQNLNTTVTLFESRVSSVEEQIENIEDSLARLIAAHNESATAHEDIREQLSELSTKFDTYIDSTDIDLDQLSEIVAYMKGIKAVEIVDELPSAENADPNKIYILRSTVENNNGEVDG